MVKYQIGVITGTPVDCKMGKYFLESNGVEAKGEYLSPNPEAQARMQMLEPEKLFRETKEGIRRLAGRGVEAVIIYCNSLASSLNLDNLRAEVALPVVTPLEVYKEEAVNYKRIALLTATNQSNQMIEKIMRQQNGDLIVIGVSLLPVVNAIEDDVNDEVIVYEKGIKEVVDMSIKLDVEALFLACTHFPYFEEEVVNYLAGKDLKLINPANGMLTKTINQISGRR